MSEPPPTSQPSSERPEHPQNIATTVAELSERATQLIREEVELAKAEVTEKALRLARGAVVGVAAGIFFVTALVFVLVGCAWLLYYLLPGGDFTYFWGFFAMALVLVVLGVIAGLVAARLVKRSAPPVPTMAIEEARLIRETVSAGVEGDGAGEEGVRADAGGAAADATGATGAAGTAADVTGATEGAGAVDVPGAEGEAGQ